jgi:hypothetical protein
VVGLPRCSAKGVSLEFGDSAQLQLLLSSLQPLCASVLEGLDVLGVARARAGIAQACRVFKASMFLFVLENRATLQAASPPGRAELISAAVSGRTQALVREIQAAVSGFQERRDRMKQPAAVAHQATSRERSGGDGSAYSQHRQAADLSAPPPSPPRQRTTRPVRSSGSAAGSLGGRQLASSGAPGPETPPVPPGRSAPELTATRRGATKTRAGQGPLSKARKQASMMRAAGQPRSADSPSSPRMEEARSALTASLVRLAQPLHDLIELFEATLGRDFSEYTRAEGRHEDAYTRSNRLLRFVFMELADGGLLCQFVDALAAAYQDRSCCCDGLVSTAGQLARPTEPARAVVAGGSQSGAAAMTIDAQRAATTFGAGDTRHDRAQQQARAAYFEAFRAAVRALMSRVIAGGADAKRLHPDLTLLPVLQEEQIQTEPMQVVDGLLALRDALR